MGKNSYLVLHKDEWDRLKKYGTKDEICIKTDERNEHMNTLLEQSQKWINTWPDSVQGKIARTKKRKEKQIRQRAEALEATKLYLSTIMENKSENAIKKARQQIFEDSCYGRQLISALLESKALEERDIQIKLKRELLKIQSEENRTDCEFYGYSIPGLSEMNKSEDVKNRQKEKMEISLFNKKLHKMQIQTNAAKRANEKQKEIEDLITIKELMDKEAKLKMTKQKEEIYIDDRKKFKERRAKRDGIEERYIEVWNKYKEKVKIKEEALHGRVHKERYNNPRSQKLYEQLKQIQDAEKQQYDDFIEKGIQRTESQAQEKEKQELNRNDELKNMYSLTQMNRKLVEENLKRIDVGKNLKLTAEPNNGNNSSIHFKLQENKPKKRHHIQKSSSETLEFLKRNDKLIKDLRKREKEWSPWSGAKTADILFAQEASDVLRQCKYKNMARKVVEEYRRMNGLNSDTLPVANY